MSRWDDDGGKPLEIATKMFIDGASFGVIAHQLYKMGYEFTRNAVLGKINRIRRTQENVAPGERKIELHRHHKLSAPKQKTIHMRKASRPIVTPAKELSFEYIGPIEAFPARNCCQYTRDDVQIPGWQMCGKPSEKDGAPWCKEHAAICFNTQATAKANAA